MIDIENQVFDTVAKALRAEHPTVWVTGEIVRKPPEFPFLQRLEAHVRAMRRAFHDAADSLFMVLMRGEGVWL